MDSSIPFSKDIGDPLSDAYAYRCLIGRLLYLTTTPPNLSFDVNKLSQFLSAPTSAHQQAATKVLRYIKGTPGLGLFFPASSDLKLKAYSDVDWATCIDTRRSVTGYCVYLDNSLISWRSKKQSTVFGSSCEAEYHAIAATACEL